MAKHIIKPGIFGKEVTAFFTGKEPGGRAAEAAATAGIEKSMVYMPLQEHTSQVVWLSELKEPETADAVVTALQGVLLGVQVADCVPILMYDRKTGNTGAVHAGWRGTAAGILNNAIEALAPNGAGEVLVALGPSIRWCCYGVGRDVLDEVIKATGTGTYHTERDGTHCLDLPTANKVQAVASGVMAHNIWMSTECTCCNPERYHSYRYTKNRDGRQGGFILKH